MRAKWIILILICASSIVEAQSLFDIAKLPDDKNESKPILTQEVLERIDWPKIRSYCDSAEGHYAHERNDSLLTTYEYTKQGRTSYFFIKSFNGEILESRGAISEAPEPNHTSFFDKQVWLKYVDQELFNLPDSFKLTDIETKQVLVSYYQLLGVDSRDEYGWICEYSAAGFPPTKRLAVMTLIQNDRIDLIKRLLHYPNTQTQLYCADALIFLDYVFKARKSQGTLSTKKYGKMKRKPYPEFDSQELTNSESETINRLRDSGQIIRTCGNMGSYKVYPKEISELLSDKMVKEIPKQYDWLLYWGYFFEQ